MKALYTKQPTEIGDTIGAGTINLGFQIIILSLLLAGYFLKVKRKFLMHGALMFVAVA
jgi:hypothetical protein